MRRLETKKFDGKIWFCPLCGHGPWPEPYLDAKALRWSYDVCDCCGCEYGYDDNLEYFADWVASGMNWFSPDAKPDGWKLENQMDQIIRPWPPVSDT